MSTTTADSNRSNDSELSTNTFEDKVVSLEDVVRNFSNDIEKSNILLKNIQAYKRNHLKREIEMRKNVQSLGKSFESIRDENKSICDARFAKVTHTLKPYLRDKEQITAADGDVKERMHNCMMKACGLEYEIKSTGDISKKVMKDYAILGVIQRKQQDAIQRFENINRAENLAYDIPPNDYRYNLVRAPGLLLALSVSPDVSDYYRKRIEGLQQRLSLLVAQIRFNSKELGLTGASYNLESLQNGEVCIDSLGDSAQVPVESL